MNNSSDRLGDFLAGELRRAAQPMHDHGEMMIDGAAETFRRWVRPMMALGRIPPGVIATMVQKGAMDGLGRDEALRLIREVAAACEATTDCGDT